MNDLRFVFGFGLVTGSLLAFAYVLVNNWRALLGAVGRREERPSLVFLAGPFLLVALAQGLRLLTPLSGAAVLTLLLTGLIIDPAALPVLAFAVYRRVRGGRR